MRSTHWMPLYVGDYLTKTMHLTAETSGAYLFLIMAYWQSEEPLPDDDEQLQVIARIAPNRWAKVRPILAKFFQIGDGLWRHKRVDEELTHAKGISQKRRQARAARPTNEGTNAPTIVPANVPPDVPSNVPTNEDTTNHLPLTKDLSLKKIEIPDLRATRGSKPSKEWIKQRWEQSISQDIIEGFGPEEGMRWIERYQADDPEAKRLFNEVSDARKADKAVRQELGWKP